MLLDMIDDENLDEFHRKLKANIMKGKTRVKINKNIGVGAVGKELIVDMKDPFWRARLKDSELDNCIEIVEPKKKAKAKGKGKN